MKRILKSVAGVTLLEIMLVLAIAAMVIVMSIRYYQSASASQQSNAILEQIQAISASADNLAQATGSYMSISGAPLSNGVLQPILPTNGLTAPWGGTITVTGASATTYTIAITSVPSSVCPLMVSKVTSNKSYTTGSACAASGGSSITFTYNASP